MGEHGCPPRHVAVIMDGNGRWAAQRGLKRSEGHKAGAEAVRKVLKAAQKMGLRYLTLYAFSTENWGRPEEEVSGLFELLVEYLDTEISELTANGVRLAAIGELESLPEKSRLALEEALKISSVNTKLTLTLALSYGSRAELTRAARLLAQEVGEGRRSPSEVTQESLAEKLWTAGQPDPDLLIRTGGDLRLSNFLLWQCAYAELHFTPTLWPDFTEDGLKAALDSYRQRERRFGLTAEQIK